MAYYIWEGGEFFKEGNLFQKEYNNVLSSIFHAEALEHGYLSLASYVRDHIPSVAELLPTTNYLSGRVYPINYPDNNFLDALNQPGNVAKLQARTKLVVLGNDALPTLTNLSVDNPGSDGWPDGKVTSYQDTGGDGTVAASSLTALGSIDTVINGEHQLLTQAGAGTIIHYLLEDDPDQAYLNTVPNQTELQSEVDAIAPASDNYLVVTATGSADLSLSDSQHRVVDGSSLRIPGAYYLGPNDPNTPAFITVPDPGVGTYQVTVDVPAAGSVTLDVTNIDGSSANDPTTVEETIAATQAGSNTYDYDPVSGQLSLASTTLPSPGDGTVSLTTTGANQQLADVVLPSSHFAMTSPAGAEVEPVFAGPTSNNPVVLGAHTVKVADIMIKNTYSLGWLFWLSLSVPVLSMLALALWQLSQKLKRL
jgi:hypothetical protein